ncbi:DUF3581 domain-containing protein [Sansalvadorimonas sp. 2012CJ34-2]|uniref:DUF3581 domain-containing protein n=1 Tax=Parendozoicomonas callyspongiae TaxID=2942213 RepID=A0ABT0PBX5_9GAMM|nr:DUF3581 family protein [Sansalvadorimonas sp. 2012CJ34-2]MCL6268726.1 DUF3581 domain-containing protein [Sansalvadorimonas sp. 2012CJ34-2]
MFLNQYFTAQTDNHFSFSREQASNFAKLVANDFNPIHDVDSKRFCVPGDLLFAKILTEEGVHASLRVQFNGMVSDGIALQISDRDNGCKALVDEAGKEYLEVCRSGDCIHDEKVIEKLVRSYVAFSGENFPHVLVPLMKEGGVMINPSRPLVIYESMSIDLDRTDLVDPKLEADGASLDIDGRRGNVTLKFIFRDQGEIVGRGKKTMVLSSLREFEQPVMDDLVSQYLQRRDSFQIAA